MASEDGYQVQGGRGWSPGDTCGAPLGGIQHYRHVLCNGHRSPIRMVTLFSFREHVCREKNLTKRPRLAAAWAFSWVGSHRALGRYAWVGSHRENALRASWVGSHRALGRSSSHRADKVPVGSLRGLMAWGCTGLTDGTLKYPFDVDEAIMELAEHATMIMIFLDPIGKALVSRSVSARSCQPVL